LILSFASCSDNGDKPKKDSGIPPLENPLPAVMFWAYQIDSLEKPGMVDKLVESHYDMVVLEPTCTNAKLSSFDCKGMVHRLQTSQGKWNKRKLVIAYVDVGEAESWRYYWKSSWKKPTETTRGDPNFLVTTDPDKWKDNYPVAYWDDAWKKIMIRDKDSMLNRVIDMGFDGIYMDWVEGFQNPKVIEAAKQVNVDAAVEMISFIKEIRQHAEKRKPGFLVIAQNGAPLYVGHTDYFQHIHAISQEQIYFDGKADTDWADPDACDIKMPETGPHSSADYEKHLKEYLKQSLPVFNVEYACKTENVNAAYTKGQVNGYVTYVTRRPLDQLTPTPPPGY
jgi:cysteinyl-tRNA synthetase